MTLAQGTGSRTQTRKPADTGDRRDDFSTFSETRNNLKARKRDVRSDVKAASLPPSHQQPGPAMGGLNRHCFYKAEIGQGPGIASTRERLYL